MNLRVATLCSGIGAPEIAFEGHDFVFSAEIDPFVSAVLAHHHPGIPNLGDITQIDGHKWRGEVDLLIGGPPCQAFSLAGKRESLADDRGQLTFEYLRLLNEINPAVAIYENVKGILSTKDNAWGKFLGCVAGDGNELFPPGRRWGNSGMVAGKWRAVAWRTIDAQHFGVPQRRKRVYAVIVNFREFGRLAGAPSEFDTGRLASVAGEIIFEYKVPSWNPSARKTAGKEIRSAAGRSTEFPPQLAGTLGAKVRHDFDTSGAYIPVSIGIEYPPAVAGTLGTGHGGRGCDLDGCGAYIPTAIGFSSVDYGNDFGLEIAPTLRAGNHVHSHQNGTGNGVAVALRKQRWEVRRLSVNECLRLQGFPDDYTDIPWGKGRSPQGRQYKAIGNSMAIPCLEYLRHCIECVLRNYREYFAIANEGEI